MKKKGLLSESIEQMAGTTQCQRCTHYKGYSKEVNDAVCPAFPGGIPDYFMFDEIPHIETDPIQEGNYIYQNSDGLKYPLMDEFTEAMHSEFTVDEETDTKHRVWALLTLCGTGNPSGWNKWMKGYNVTIEDINKHLQEFKDLSNE